VILTPNATTQFPEAEKFREHDIRTNVLALCDLTGERLAQCLAPPESPVAEFEQRDDVDNVDREFVDVAPKIQIVQSLLNYIVGDGTLDATVIISRTFGSQDDENGDGTHAIEEIVRLPSLVLQGQSLAALAACHGAESALDKCPTRDVIKSKVINLRRCLEQELLTTEIELVTPEARVHPIASRSVLIGRPSHTRKVDIALNCRWFSRGERSLSLFSDNSEWFIEDLGSANGSFIGEKQLQNNERVCLPIGQTVVEIGRSLDKCAPVVLTLNRVSCDAVIVSVGVGAGFDKSGSQTWPSLQEDLTKRWVVFGEEFIIGSGELSESLGFFPQEKSAAITYGGGFWMTPIGGTDLRLDERVFRTAVPLPPEVDLELGALRLRVVRARSSATTKNSDIGVEPANNRLLR
jgi:hypothetical protein